MKKDLKIIVPLKKNPAHHITSQVYLLKIPRKLKKARQITEKRKNNLKSSVQNRLHQILIHTCVN